MQWAFPKLGLRWRGFKNVRRQVCRRVVLRIRELDLDAQRYRSLLEKDPKELRHLGSLCFVTISRFYRDRQIYDLLAQSLLPALIEHETQPARLRIWSAGCASGEEPYTLSILWSLAIAPRYPDVALEVIATDANEEVLARAKRGVYDATSLSELPPAWRERAFDDTPDITQLRLKDEFRAAVTFERQDIRSYLPESPLHIVMCRNLAFTYFDAHAQTVFLERISTRLVVPNGLLVIGAGERFEAGIDDERLWEADPSSPYVFRNRGGI